MNHAIVKTLTLLSSPSEMRLALGTDREPKRVLPLGLAMSLWLKKSMLFGAVLIAVATIILASSIREEGLKGMSPNSDKNGFAQLGIIVMLFGLTLFAPGAHEAFTTYELLKSGLKGASEEESELQLERVIVIFRYFFLIFL